MKIVKIFGFLAPALKEKDSIDESTIVGEEIESTSKLNEIVSEIFHKSERECDIPIKFVSTDGKQVNDVREQVIVLNTDFNIKNCISLVRSLSYLTDGKTKDGIVFFVNARDENESKILITRFPAETGITINPNGGKANFDVIEDVFLKNSRKYKAVYYHSSEQFWVGYAVDKQVNEGKGKIKEISDYWIKMFLKSELKITSKRGTAILAKAVRNTLDTTENEKIKEELVSLSTTIKNADKKAVSFDSFFNDMNLSADTKSEVLRKIPNELVHIKFHIDEEEFRINCNYLVKVLDNGAIVIGPAKDFNVIWSEMVAEGNESTYSTTGRAIKSKLQQRV